MEKQLEFDELIKTTNEVITLVPKHGHQQGNIILIPVKDGRSGYFKGIPHDWKKRVDRGEEVETPDSQYVCDLINGKPIEFDLNSQKMANIWAWVQHCSWVAKSKDELRYKPEALLYPDEPDKELEEKLKVSDVKFDLEKWAREATLETQIDICRFFNQKVRNTKPNDIRDFLITLSRGDKYKDLLKVKEHYEVKKDAKKLLFIFKLEDVNLITKDKTGGIKYKDEFYSTPERFLEWLYDTKNAKELEVLMAKVAFDKIETK